MENPVEKPVLPPEKKDAPAKVALMLFGVVGAFVVLIIVIGWIIVARG